jgi:hypothetical protein
MINLGRVSERTKGVITLPYFEDLSKCVRGGIQQANPGQCAV